MSRLPGRARVGEFLAVANPRRVLLLSGAHATNEFFSVALPPILPLLIAGFDITYAEAGLLLSVFFGAYTVFQLPAGFLADRIGGWWLIVSGTLGLAAGTLLASVADSVAALAGAQALAGISGSTYHPSGMSMLSDVETADTEGRAMGIHGFGGLVGVALAPVVVGGLAGGYGWRAGLVAAGAVGVAFAAAFGLLYPRGGPAGGGEPDEPVPANGAADEDGGDNVDSSDGSEGSLAGPVEQLRAAAAALAGPHMTTAVLLLLLINVVVAVEVRATQSFTTVYAYDRVVGSTGAANLVFLALLVGSAVASLGAGRLADLLDRGKLGAAAALLTAGMLATTGFVPPTLPAMTGWFFLVGAVMYVQAPTMNALAANVSDPTSSGGLFGMIATASALGGAMAPTLYGSLATYFNANVAFAAIGLFPLAGAAAFWRLSGVGERSADGAGTA